MSFTVKENRKVQAWLIPPTDPDSDGIGSMWGVTVRYVDGRHLLDRDGFSGPGHAVQWLHKWGKQREINVGIGGWCGVPPAEVAP